MLLPTTEKRKPSLRVPVGRDPCRWHVAHFAFKAPDPFLVKASLDFATKQFLEHYHQERPHQGLDNELVLKLKPPSEPTVDIVCDKRLGGLLMSYRRAA